MDSALETAPDSDGALVTPLRFPVVPNIDESLPGLLSRATRENVLESTSIVLKRAGLDLLHPGTVCTASQAQLEKLAAIFRCAPSDVIALAHPYLTDRSKGGPVKFGAAAVMREDLVLDRRRIAPLTLERSDYHRAWWLLRLLPYCPLSLERLVDQCPRCPEKPLGWRRSWGIAFCEWCEKRVPPSTEPALNDELAADYRAFADLVSHDPIARDRVLVQMPDEVRSLDGQTLLSCILQIGATCRSEPIRSKRIAMSWLPADMLPPIICTGVRLLKGWPESVQLWSRDRFAALEKDDAEVAKLRVSLRRLGLSRSAGPNQVAFIREGMPELFRSYDRSFADLDDIVLADEATRLTGLDLTQIRELRTAGLLTTRFEHGKKRRRRQYVKAEVEELARCARGSGPSTFLESQLGVPLYGIEQMCCLNLVEEERHPGVALISGGLQLTRASMNNLLERLEARAHPSVSPPNAVPLGTAVRCIGGREKPWGAIISSLLDGSLCYWIAPGRSYLRRILVQQAEIRSFQDFSFDPNLFPHYCFSPEVNQKDCEDLLNIDREQIYVARCQNLVVFRSDGSSLRADKKRVLELAERLIAPSELAAISALRAKSAAALMRKKGVARVAFGWDRAEALFALS